MKTASSTKAPRAPKVAVNHDAHVQAYEANWAEQYNEAKAIDEARQANPVVALLEQFDAGVASGEIVAPAVVGAPSFKLAGKAAQDRATMQAGAKTGMGMAWRSVAAPATNTRLVALAQLQALGDTFTEAEALAALAQIKAKLGSGTPRSYWKAFTTSGYIAQA